jgi:hypothetical protein
VSDLREALAKALCDLQGYWDDEAEEDREGFRLDADTALHVLADPEHRRAIFAAMGLESPPYVLRHRGSDWMLVRPRAEKPHG